MFHPGQARFHPASYNLMIGTEFFSLHSKHRSLYICVMRL